jgi:predicted neuraminidase
MMRNTVATTFFVLALIGVFFPALYSGFTRDLSRQFVVPEAPDASAACDASALYREDFVEKGLAPSQHCASMVELGNGNLLAVWYAGSNEGEPDVSLYQVVWNKRTGTWSEPRLLTNVAKTQEEVGTYTKKIGNAVLLKDSDGRIWLFYVSVSLGGWSGSAINYIISDDEGRNWSPAKRLVTNPFLNMGDLVKSAPVLYRDGTIGLPTYHEMFGMFGELVHLAPDGSVLDKSLISPDRMSLQPAIVPLSPKRAIAFLRNKGSEPKRIVCADTRDGGRTWMNGRKISLPNPNAPVACVRDRDGLLWLVFNNTVEFRDTMVLAKSPDEGKTWKELYMFETKEGTRNIEGVSYPFLVGMDDCVFHLLYTWDRSRIKHIMFNKAWLKKL